MASVTVREFIHGNGTEVGNRDGLGSIVLPRPIPQPLIAEVLKWPLTHIAEARFKDC